MGEVARWSRDSAEVERGQGIAEADDVAMRITVGHDRGCEGFWAVSEDVPGLHGAGDSACGAVMSLLLAMAERVKQGGSVGRMELFARRIGWVGPVDLKPERVR